jgi:hypothetical protein
MAKCPNCAQDCPTPFFLNMQGWRELVCPHCTARLDRKNPRFVVPLLGLWPGIMALTRLYGHRFVYFADAFLLGTFLIMLAEFLRPELQLRKPPPKPEIRLKLNG